MVSKLRERHLGQVGLPLTGAEFHPKAEMLAQRSTAIDADVLVLSRPTAPCIFEHAKAGILPLGNPAWPSTGWASATFALMAAAQAASLVAR